MKPSRGSSARLEAEAEVEQKEVLSTVQSAIAEVVCAGAACARLAATYASCEWPATVALDSSAV
jgi:hypothetical protein